MSRFTEKLIRFFRGRYGIDEFNRFLFWFYLATVIAMTVTELFVRNWITIALRILFALIAVYMIFRAMSRSICVRQKENRRYLAVRNAVCGWFRLQKNRIRDRKTHIYRKCPYCRAILRLKRLPGKHRAACPSCGKSFEVTVR